VAKDFPKITDHLCQECQEHFKGFCGYLDLYGIAYEVEPRLVRGLDYYTKTTFEIISSKLGAQDAILGGGRYDYMMKEFGGPDICGIGFAMGVERFLSVVPDEETKERFVFIAHMGEAAKKAGLQLAREIRKEKIECLIEYREKSLKNQMSRANKLSASWVVIIGEEEVSTRRFQLKDMETGEQKEMTETEIIAALKQSG
jgi:histidyl-tRNA synthetase